jgi:filamentous hemagglutinin family protein
LGSRASLNHVYRTIWNQSLGAMVAVAEIAPSQGGGSAPGGGHSQPLPTPQDVVARIGTLALSIALVWGVTAPLVQANPTGAAAIVGSANLATQGNKLTVTTQNGVGLQHSAINWQSFSVPAGNTTHFQQPSAASMVINRVVTNVPSQLFGTLSSNGHLVLVNQAGIAVGAGALVDTAGFTASALRMTDADALAGRLRFGDATVSTAGVSVQGRILARSGDAVLIGSSLDVGQDALIQAPNGSTLLAAGQQVEVTGRGLEGISFQLQAPTDQALNLGKLSGNAVGIFAGTLKHSGQIRADAVTVEGGKVVLKASRQIDVAGQVSAQALNQRGGTIQATAPEVQLRTSAVLDASGAAGGGELLVGGGYQGKDARLSNAQTTTVEMGAQLRADATAQGDGGTVIVWADDTTRVHGSVSARGGPQGGDGGFIETSGKRLLDVNQAADASAPLGTGGTWLLDPYDITIGPTGTGLLSGIGTPKTFTSFTASSLISASTISSALNAGTSVIISTGSGGGEAGDITVASPITKISGVDATLTLTAHNDVKLNANISSTSNKLNLVMNPDSDNSGYGGTVLGTASASLNGGAFTATSNGGRVRMSPTGAFNLNNAVASLGVLSFEPSTQLVANASGSFAVGSVNFNGGLLDIQSGGTDTATYNLNNYGTLRFSGFSTRTISGAINGDGTGTLETQLGKTLSGVNINTSLTQVGTLAFSGVTTLGNGVTVSKGNSTWLFEAGASIATGGSSTPIATIANAGGSIYAAYNAAGGLTFGQGLTVRGYGAIRGDWASYAATLNNLGTIWSDTLGQTFTVNGNSLSNTGLLQATAGTMSLGPSSGVTNGGELLVNGGVMTVNVPVSGTGTATVQNGTMNLNAATSVQTMSLTGGTLGGSGDVSVTNSFTQTGGVINKTGSLSINQASGNLVLENIAAGSLTATATANITQTPLSSLVISGTTSLAATGGHIILEQLGNDFNTVAFTSTKNSGGYGGTVSLVDSNSLVIAPIGPDPSIGESVFLAANQLSLAEGASVSSYYIDVRTDALSLAAGSSLNAAGGMLSIQPRSDSRSMRIGNIDAVDPATVLYLPAAAIGTSIVASGLTLGSDSSTYGGTTTVSGGLVNPAGGALTLLGGGTDSAGRLAVDAVTNNGRSVFLSAGTGGIAVSGLIDTRGQSVPDGSGSAGGSVTVGSNGNVALNAIKTSGGDGGNGGGGNAGNVDVLAGGDISVSGPSAGIWANGGASSGNSGGGLAGEIQLRAGAYSYGGSSGGDVTLSVATISNSGASNAGISTLYINARQGGGSSPTNGAVNIAGSTITTTTSPVTIYSANNLGITGSSVAATNGNIDLRAGWDPTADEGYGAASVPGGNVTLRSSSFTATATANQAAGVMINAYGSSSTTGNVVIERNSATPLVGSTITADYLEIYAARDIDIRKGSVLTTRQFDLDLTAGSVNGHSSSGPGGYLTVEGATIDAGNTAYLAAISGAGINSSNGGAVTISQTTEPSPVRSLIRAGFIDGQADSHFNITNSDLALTTLCAGVCPGPLVDLTAGDKQTLGGNLDLTGSTIKGQLAQNQLPVPGLVDLRANRTSLGAFGNVALGAIQADALSVSAGSNVTQSAALEITGATILAAGRQGYGGSVTLAHPGNSFGTVDVSAPYGGAISLVSSGAMTVNNLVNIPGHDVSLVASGSLNLDLSFLGVLHAIDTGNANLTLSSGGNLTTPGNLSGANVDLVANQLILSAGAAVIGSHIGIRADALTLPAGSSLTASGSIDIQPNAANRSMQIGGVDPSGVLYLSSAGVSSLNYGTHLWLGSGNPTYSGTTTVPDGLNVLGAKDLTLRGGGGYSSGSLMVGGVTNRGGEVTLFAGSGGIDVTGLIDTRGTLVNNSNSTNGGNFSVISGGNVSLNRVDTSGGGGSNSGYLGGDAGTVMVLAAGNISVTGSNASIYADGGDANTPTKVGNGGGITLSAGQSAPSTPSATGGNVTLFPAVIHATGRNSAPVSITASEGASSPSPSGSGSVTFTASGITASNIAISAANDLVITGGFFDADNGNAVWRAGWVPNEAGSGVGSTQGGNMSLTNATIGASGIQLSTGAGPVIAGTMAITGSTLSTSGNLIAQAAGDLTQTAGVITVTGATNLILAPNANVTLNQPGNDFNTVSVTQIGSGNVGAVSLRDVNGITLDTVRATSLAVTAGGNITQTGYGGSVTVSGASTFTATGGDIVLGQANNDFGSLAATATPSNGVGGSVSLIDLNVLNLGNVVATNLTVSAGTDLVQSGGTAVVSTGSASLTAGAGESVGNIFLNEPLNNFNTVAVTAAYGGAIRLTDTNALTVSSLNTASSQLNLNQAISLVAGGALVLPTVNLNTGTADLTLSSGGTLTTPGNLAGADVALTGTTGLTLAHSVAASGTLALNGGNVQVNSVVSSGGAMSVNASGSLQVLADTAGASLNALGNQTITADSLLLRGGGSGSARSALVSSSGAQTITTTQGIALQGGAAGGGLGVGNFSRIKSDGNQSITAGSGGIVLTGGGGTGSVETDNFALIYHSGITAGSTQSLTLGNGGTLRLTGGSSARSPVGSGHGSFALVQGDGNAQNISFTNGGGIALTGGTAGSRARAMVYAGGSASQTITGGPTVVLTGGSGNNGVTGEDNHAEIGTLNGSQSLTVASIALSGGVGGNMNRAAIYQGGATGTQTVNVSAGGSIQLQGGTGTASASNFAVIAAQGAAQNVSFAGVGGALSLTGGTVGTDNFAGVMSQNSGLQTIAGVTSLALTGGGSGGAAGLGNRAVITTSGGAQNVTAATIALLGGASGTENVALLTAGSSGGSQTQSITAGSISLSSGLGGVSNGVAFRAPNQAIVTTGNLSMAGGGSSQGGWRSILPSIFIQIQNTTYFGYVAEVFGSMLRSPVCSRHSAA